MGSRFETEVKLYSFPDELLYSERQVANKLILKSSIIHLIFGVHSSWRQRLFRVSY